METLSQMLQPYATVVSTLATVVTMSQLVAPAIIIKEIYDAKSTKGKPGTPFVMGVSIGLLMMIYAHLVNDPVMIFSNYLGNVVSAFYAYCYYYYVEEKMAFLKSLAKGIAGISVIYLYTKIENPEYVEQRFGICLTVTMFGFIAAPLFGLKEIIAKRNAEIMPIPMIVCGTAMSCLWLLHGIIILNYIMIFQNLIFGTLSAVQLAVWVLFRGGVPEKTKKQE